MTSKTHDLRGKVVLLSGAGRPLGRVLAEGFAQAGASLALHDLLPTHLDQTCLSVEELGAQCRSYTGDTGKGLPARQLVSDVVADWGRLDVLVNCMHARPEAGLVELDEWDWTRTLEVNLSGPFLLAQAAAQVMREQGEGVILNVLGGLPSRPSPALDASQMGLAGFTRAIAAELSAYNIFSYAIDAGGVLELQDDPERAAALQKSLQSLALFLCSPAAVRHAGQVMRPE
jgi:NAD(P)-dependent dehydrogenase (short-subunit alcohol dehydrogenase family)